MLDVTQVARAGGLGFIVLLNIISSCLLCSAGSDYTPLSMEPISLPRNTFSTTVTISIINDTVPETTERFELAIVEASLANVYLLKPVGVVSILDEGKKPTSCSYLFA